MAFKVAYILDCFPVVSQTFISDEIYLLLQRKNIEINIFSLEKPKSTVHHGRVKEVLDVIDINYLQPPAAGAKAKVLLKRFLLHPIKTVRQLYAFTKVNQERWINFDALVYSEIIQNFGADHIHSHFAGKAAKTSMAISIWSGMPFSFMTHGYDVFFKPPGNYSQLVEKAKYVFTISQYNKTYLVDNFHLQENKIKVVYCGIILTDYLGIPFKDHNSDGRVSLLTVARLRPVKGHKYLLHALHLLRERINFNFDLFLAGDGSEMDFLKDLAAKLNLIDMVHFLGNQSQFQVCDLLQKCDYFVLPSISEGLPIVLLEAMASSRLVIAPNVNGVPELVIDNETGLLFEPENIDSLASAIERAVSDTIKYSSMITAARSKVVDQFSKDVAIDHLIKYWRG